jgi:hypothetical protein
MVEQGSGAYTQNSEHTRDHTDIRKEKEMKNIALLRRLIGAILLIMIGVIHLLIIRPGFHLQEYLGILFIVEVVAAFVSALWIGIQDSSMGWLLGGVAALAPLVGYIVTRTIGLPGIPLLPWMVPTGLLSLVVEAIVVVLAISVLAQRLSPRPTTPPSTMAVR